MTSLHGVSELVGKETVFDRLSYSILFIYHYLFMARKDFLAKISFMKCQRRFECSPVTNSEKFVISSIAV